MNPIKMSKAAHKICKKMTKISAKKQNSTDLWSSGAVINTMSCVDKKDATFKFTSKTQ